MLLEGGNALAFLRCTGLRFTIWDGISHGNAAHLYRSHFSQCYTGGKLTLRANVDLPALSRVTLASVGDQLYLTLTNDTIQVNDYTNNASRYQLSFNGPLFKAFFRGAAYTSGISGPVTVLGTNTFRIKVTNDLPFQASCGCGCTVNGDAAYCNACQAAHVPSTTNPLGTVNGAHNLMYSNLHLHGMKTDPGANNVNALDPCKSLYTKEQQCGKDPAFKPSRLKCDVHGDNIFVTGLPGGMQVANTYVVAPMMPGMMWYHHHQHGDVAYINPTSNGAIIIPDINPNQLFKPAGVGRYKDRKGITSWPDWQKGLTGTSAANLSDSSTLTSDAQVVPNTWTQYKEWTPSRLWPSQSAWETANNATWRSMGATDAQVNRCMSFTRIMSRFPNFSNNTEILHIAGLWFRKTVTGAPDTDTIPYIGCIAQPPSPLICPKGRTNGIYNLEKMDNRAGLDWAPINGAVQPTVKLQTGRYKRWLLLNTFTMKWLDLSIREMPDAKSSTEWQPFGAATTACKFWLLGHDGVYLESLPRSIRTSDTVTGQVGVNNMVLGPANRADILIKCSKPGRYALVSGAGPSNTVFNCGATHCELFGGRGTMPTAGGGATSQVTGNHYYKGRLLSAALMAVIQVDTPAECATEAPPPSCQQEADLEDNMCRTRQELFHYTDTASFPATNTAANTENQCILFGNQMGGAMCAVNGVMFGAIATPSAAGLICMSQGKLERWTYNKAVFHPAHMHATPVRVTSLPPCITTGTVVSNFWQTGDWFDTFYHPSCACGGPTCDQVKVEFMSAAYPPTPRSFNTTSIGLLRAQAKRYLSQLEELTGNPTARGCEDRLSVMHCHHLSHEDNGCMAVVYWKCPSSNNNPIQCGPLAACPGAAG